MTRTGTGMNAVFSGPLYESTGPAYSATFDPNAVTRRQVGTMTFRLYDAGHAALSYSVDGASVSKTVERFAFGKNDLSGTYFGHTVANNAAPTGLDHNAANIDIQDGDAGFTMRMYPASTSNNLDTCTFTAPPATQAGQFRSVAGTYACNSGETGAFSMENLYVSFHGFTGTFMGRGVVGHIEGTRRNQN